MKKIISLVLVIALIASSSVFTFATTEKNIPVPMLTQLLYKGAINDPALTNKLQK